MDLSRRQSLNRTLPADSMAIAQAQSRHFPEQVLMSTKAPEPQFQAAYLEAEQEGRLANLERELWNILQHCRLCPRQCGVNWLKDETGFCCSSARLKVASNGPHFGEERPLVGTGGSGTIFFPNCNPLCCFCQNWEINHRGDGHDITHADLAGMMLSLQRRGCHNINLVNPTHVLPHIIKALCLILGFRGAPAVFLKPGFGEDCTPECVQQGSSQPFPV